MHLKSEMKYHPQSLVSEMGERLPDVPIADLRKYVRKMAAEGVLIYDEVGNIDVTACRSLFLLRAGRKQRFFMMQKKNSFVTASYSTSLFVR